MQPKLLSIPFANNAGASTKNEIPDSPGPTLAPQQATWEEGFPIITMQPPTIGGIPPQGGDFNGVLNALSEHTVYQNAGGMYKFSAELAASIGGYSKGAILISDDGETLYRSRVDGNSVNPNVSGVGADWDNATGDASLRLDLADPSEGASLVATGTRTQEEKNQDILSVRDEMTSQVDGTTNNQAWVNAAVQRAKSLDEPLFWPRGTYNCPDSIPDFWSVEHYGPGVIKRGSDVFFITPKRNQLSQIYSSITGIDSNDGLSSESPCSISSAFQQRLNSLGGRASKGQWRLRISGQGEADGIFLSGYPYFSKPLQIWGDEITGFNKPSVSWDGSSSSRSYAIRANHGNTALSLDLRYIEFKNWQKDVGNSGAFVCDDRLLLDVQSCWFTSVDIGLWVLQSYIKVMSCTFTDCKTWGVNVSYLSYGNIGLLGSGNGNKFIRCGSSVSAARSSVCYLQNNDIEEIVSNALNIDKTSRARTQGNRYKSWSANPSSAPSVYNVVEGGRLEGDNFQGNPDVFTLPISDSFPVYRSERAGMHSNIQNGNALFLNSMKTLSGSYSANERVLVPAADPLVLPSYALYSSTGFKIVIEVLVTVSSGKTFGLDISGEGVSISSRIAYATLPAPSSSRAVLVRFTVTKPPTGSMLCDIECPALNHYQYAVNVNSALSQPSVRSPDDSRKTFRLYVTPGPESGSVSPLRIEGWIAI